MCLNSRKFLHSHNVNHWFLSIFNPVTGSPTQLPNNLFLSSQNPFQLTPVFEGAIQKVEDGRVGSLKSKQNEQGVGGGWAGCSMCVHLLFLKKMLRFPTWSLIVILQYFILIIMAVWNIKQTFMKDYNIILIDNIPSFQWMQQWMTRVRFHQPTQDYHCRFC